MAKVLVEKYKIGGIVEMQLVKETGSASAMEMVRQP